MSFFQNIKTKFANKLISRRQKSNKRKKEFHNLQSAKNIGIIFDTLNDKNHSIVKKIAEDLRQKGYKVSATGWIDANEVPDFGIAQKILFYTNKDVKWFGEPIVPELIEFMNEQFDLLFILSNSDRFAIKYITHVSAASCKVGALTNNCEHLDLMIDQNQNTSLENLVNEIIKYLSQIKKE